MGYFTMPCSYYRIKDNFMRGVHVFGSRNYLDRRAVQKSGVNIARTIR